LGFPVNLSNQYKQPTKTKNLRVWAGEAYPDKESSAAQQKNDSFME